MSMLAVPVLFFALVLSLKNGEALNCWKCSSILSSDCNDPFPVGLLSYTNSSLEITHENCTVPYSFSLTSKPVCRKQQLILFGQVITIRGCAWKDIADDFVTCKKTLIGQEAVQFCETCNQDKCNSAPAFGTTLAVIAPFSLLLLTK